MKGHHFVYVIMVIFLFGCKQKEEGLTHYLKPDFKQQYLNSSLLRFVDTIKVAVPDESFNYFWQSDLWDDRVFYGFSYIEPLAMSVIDLQDGVFADFVRFDKNLVGGTMIHNFKVLSPDSILLAVYPGKNLVLVNRSGKVLSKLYEDDLKIAEDLDVYIAKNGYEWATNSYLENMSYDSDTKLLYVPLTPNSDYYDMQGYSGVRRHGIYDLATNRWKTIYAPWAGTLKYLGEGRYYSDMETSYQLVTPDSIYITYPVDHSVYIYDSKNFKLRRSIDISPSVAVDVPMPLYGTESDNYEKLGALRRSSPFYGPLYYHKGVKKFSRFYNLKKQSDKTDRRAIVVYDEDFNIVAEEIFPLQEISAIRPSPTGFVIQPYDPMIADTATFFRVSIIDR
jgi:hypothetical protein